MGYLNTANDMVDNATKLLSDVIDSKFATYLQGNGTPVLVTYYHVDDTLSTSDWGNYTVDKVLGDDSPIRFNRIENFPLFGLKELLPSIELMDGNLMDMSIDGEVIALPGTIKPTPLDLFVYRYKNGNSITFKITGIELSSIKNNDFYKMAISLKDINDMDTIEKAEKQCIKGYVAKVDNIGTQDKCIIEDKILVEINNIERLVSYLIEQYKVLFYDRRYNCILLRHSQFNDYPIYDPMLTTFIQKHDLLDSSDDYVVIQNFDYRPCIDSWYRSSIWRNLELRNSTHMKLHIMSPDSFRTVDTNPFYHYGEENVFTLSLSKYPLNLPSDHIKYIYGDKELLYSIMYYEPPKKKNLSARPSKGNMIETDITPIKNSNISSEDLIDRFNPNLNPNDFSKPDDNSKKLNYDSRSVSESLMTSKCDLCDIYEEDYTDNSLHDIPLLDKPKPPKQEEKPETIELFPSYMNFIRDYFITDSMYNLFTADDISKLYDMDIEYNHTDFMHIPMLIYILRKYINYLTNN